ncbi:MAG: hypothetical protein QXU71_03985 [Candidatus Aenigmatarchaeota archaeon]
MGKNILKRILLAIILLLGFFTFHIGLILAMQGEYFYKITSREKFNELTDKIIIEMIEKRDDFKEICKSLNISCNSFEEIVEKTCEKSNEIRKEYENLIKNITRNDNLTDEDAIRLICSHNKDACNQISIARDYVNQIENLCSELKKSKEDVEREKEKIYEKNLIDNISLKKVNESLKDSFYYGIILISTGVLLIYLATRSFQKLFKNVFKITLITGIICLLIWFFGTELLIKFLSEKIESMALKNFISEIFEFEKNSGILLSLVGIFGFLSVYVISFYLSPNHKKNKTIKITKNEIK